jgi:hypothetical protein
MIGYLPFHLMSGCPLTILGVALRNALLLGVNLPPYLAKRWFVAYGVTSVAF